ncbi:helicase-related protein [Micromonospora sp. NPDC047548]|uniref:helicase-related protein n=1 Tax=Micromonospora sp. NPDC047548 TaxID=3155624 RepID=UPI0033EC5F32
MLSLRAAGTGLNLTRADHVVHFDRWWNPAVEDQAVEDQATDRAYRIGQIRPVQVHRLIAEGTVEDRIAALLAGKRDLAEAVLDAGPRSPGRPRRRRAGRPGHPARAGVTARGFPAFPAGPARRTRSGWATGWAAALAESALDPEPVRRGRRLAARGHVGPITISPGRIAASVHDGDPDRAHRTVVRVETLPDADWDRLAVAVADRSGRLAALLAGQLPAELAESAGVRLPPTGGQLLPECDCPDWDHPCRHAAALCHQVSWLLEGEPLLLLLIRGRDAGDLLADGRPSTRVGVTAVDRQRPGGRPGRVWAAATLMASTDHRPGRRA